MARRVQIRFIKGKLVHVVKIDSKGRVVIPQEIREHISADSFAVELTPDGKILLDPIKNQKIKGGDS